MKLKLPLPLLLFFLFLPACIPSPPPLLTSSPPPPSPDTLLAALDAALALEQDAWERYDYGNFRGDFLTSPEARALLAYIQTDLDRFYPDGFPDAGQILAQNRLTPPIWLPPQPVWTLVQFGLVDLINQQGIQIQDRAPIRLLDFDILPLPAELDGDPGPEWLLETRSERYNLTGWFPVERTAEGLYRRIPNGLRAENRVRGETLTWTLTPDLNRDGLPDVAAQLDAAALGTGFGYLRVYGRVAEGIRLLDEIQTAPGEQIEIGDHDSDGLAEIQHTRPRSLNFDCQWTQIDRYRWEGETPRFVTLQEQPPDTPLCQAAQALSPIAPLPPAARAQLLESAIPALPAASPDYLALLYVHLAMAYAAQGWDAQAAQTLDALERLPQDAFVAQARALWEQAGRSPLALCYALSDAAARGEPENTALAVYLTPAALFRAYGSAQKSYAALVCPLEMVVGERLGRVRIPAGERDPVGALAARGYRLAFPLRLDVDGGPSGEWFALAELERPRLLLLEMGEDGWRAGWLVAFAAPLADLRIANYGGYGDHGDEAGEPGGLLVLATFDESTPVSAYPDCWAQAAAVVSRLVLLARTGQGYRAERETILCGSPPDLQGLAAEGVEALFPPPPARPTLDQARAFYRYLSRLEAQLLRAEALETLRLEFEEIAKEIPPDHPDREAVVPRLLYARGMSYELAGEEQGAARLYRELIEQYPDSPWAVLARGRVRDDS